MNKVISKNSFWKSLTVECFITNFIIGTVLIKEANENSDTTHVSSFVLWVVAYIGLSIIGTMWNMIPGYNCGTHKDRTSLKELAIRPKTVGEVLGKIFVCNPLVLIRIIIIKILSLKISE